MIRYKIDVGEELKKRGFTSTRILHERLLPSGTLKTAKEGKSITLESLGKICCMLRCQPGDIIENVITDDEKIKYF